jgi:putative transposase
MIDKGDKLPVTRQCDILDLSRSGVYYTPAPLSAKEMELMRKIDEIHLATPFYGSRKIRDELWAKGYDAGWASRRCMSSQDSLWRILRM